MYACILRCVCVHVCWYSAPETPGLLTGDTGPHSSEHSSNHHHHPGQQQQQQQHQGSPVVTHATTSGATVSTSDPDLQHTAGINGTAHSSSSTGTCVIHLSQHAGYCVYSVQAVQPGPLITSSLLTVHTSHRCCGKTHWERSPYLVTIAT